MYSAGFSAADRSERVVGFNGTRTFLSAHSADRNVRVPTMKNDWSKFTKRITVNSNMRAIYNAWAIPAEIERWFLASAEYKTSDNKSRSKNERVLSGDTYEWKWHGYPNGAVERGKILEANGHDALSFTFADECVVDVIILSENGEKVVQLLQKQIKPDENLQVYVGCGEGWTFYLANLKSVLEGGVDLRNKNVNISNVVNA